VPNLTTFAVPSHGLHASPPASRAGVRLAVLVPTHNEAANIETLLERTGAAVAGIPTEVVFVDDSDDDTPAAIGAAARRTAGGAFQVSLIHRQGSQRSGGLGGAVLDGLRHTEVGFTFADRHAGQSKGSLREGLSYLGSLCELRLDRGAPAPSRPGGRDVALD
jgi:cellulose synthase/poly-beta-1,6-N-acetylglucosamine synthase-like glycosyltransferase